MYDVMQGVKVIEVAEHTFVPAAAMLLADWGADVIKIERVAGGDAARSMRVIQRPGLKVNPFFEAPNRGKRGLGLDLNLPEGREVLHKLLAGADVFITNLRTDARIKLGIEGRPLLERYPRLVYGRGTGFGMAGPMAEHRGFDFPTSWCRSGSAYVQTPDNGEPPPSQPGSVGDLMGGATLAGAICAALFRRERTGKGAIVDNALYLVGSYIMTQSLIAAGLGWKPPDRKPTRETATDPVNNMYRTKDGRWLVLCLLYDEWWDDLARHMKPEWLKDPRYASVALRTDNNRALIGEMDAIFATKTLAEWRQALHTMKGVWAPLLSPGEVIEDEQALAAGFVTPVTIDEQSSYLAAASPGQFDERPVGPLTSAPTLGQHTDAVMHEIGFGSEDIKALKARKVIC